VIQAGCRAIAVPYAGGSETEQTLRGKLLIERAGIHVLPETELAAATLAATIERAMAAAPARPGGIDANGAAVSAQLIRGFAEAAAW